MVYNTELSLIADSNIHINAGITGRPALSKLGLRVNTGVIDQLTTAAISVPNVVAVSNSGSVMLMNAGNNVSTIAGSAGSSFRFTNSGAINVGSVLTVAANPTGISANGAGVAIELQGSAITQAAGSPIATPNGLKLVTAGAVTLDDTANNVGQLTATGVNSLSYRNSGALTVGVAGTGVSGSGSIDIRSANSLTVQEAVSGLGLTLQANGAAKDLVINAPLNAGDGSGALSAVHDILLNGATLSGIGTTALSAGNVVTANTGTTTLNTTVSLSSPMSIVSGATLKLSDTAFGSGNIALGFGASLNNAGTFDIQNGGGFTPSASPAPITNAGMFKKSAGTASLVSGASFTNTSTGTVDVAAGTLGFGAGVLSSNAGTIKLGSGATLDTANTSLNNTGTISGSGTLNLGTGTLTNSGSVLPGGAGTIGTMNITAAAFNNTGSSVLTFDMSSAASDLLSVVGPTTFAAGSTVAINQISAPLPGTYTLLANTTGPPPARCPT